MKKVLITKIGLDGHEVGARMIFRLLEENGFDIEYLGIRQTVESVMSKALKTKPDFIGVSIMTGGHLHFMPKLKAELNKKGLEKTKLVLGGLIPQEDIKQLDGIVDKVFPNGSTFDEILKYFNN